jgi:ribosomal protein S19E (S16A)
VINVDNDMVLQMMAMMNPELAPFMEMLRSQNAVEDKPKRKPSAYNRRYAAAYRRIKRSKTLKSGKMAKGFGGRRGHLRIVKMAHAQAKKGGRR